MVMNYNQQSEDFNTLDRPIASEDNTVRFEDGSTMFAQLLLCFQPRKTRSHL